MEISDTQRIQSWLNEIHRANIPSVKTDVREGDEISTLRRITDDYYMIDNPKIYTKFGITLNQKTPKIMEVIYNSLPLHLEDRKNLFDEEGKIPKVDTGDSDIIFERRILPFSRAIDKGIGTCLERSILLQLAKQDQIPVFLIKCDAKIGDINNGHCFNIIFEDRALLVDVKPYLTSTLHSYKPYIIPIESINTKTGVITLDKELSEDRSYKICHISDR